MVLVSSSYNLRLTRRSNHRRQQRTKCGTREREREQEEDEEKEKKPEDSEPALLSSAAVAEPLVYGLLTQNFA